MIEYTVIVNGDYQEWYLNGKRHREDGPAIINGDYQAWYLNGKRHREDGPAAVVGSDYRAWYLNGEYVIEAEHAKRTRKQPSCHGKVVEIDGRSYRLEEV